MPFLEITHLNGEVERRPLEKQQPLSIGSHSSNDIRIDEEGVESLHCRVSWNKKAFEAVAAGVDGIEINGNLVQRAVLKQGDILRFGSVDLRFVESDEADVGKAQAGATAGLDSGAIALKPLTEDIDVPDWLRGESEQKARPSPKPEPQLKPDETRPGRSRTSPGKPVTEPPKPAASRSPEKPFEKPRTEKTTAKPKAAPAPPDDDFDLDAGLEALAQESRSSIPTFRGSSDTADYDQPPAPKQRKSQPDSPLPEPPAASPPPEPDLADVLAEALSRRREMLRHRGMRLSDAKRIVCARRSVISGHGRARKMSSSLRWFWDSPAPRSLHCSWQRSSTLSVSDALCRRSSTSRKNSSPAASTRRRSRPSTCFCRSTASMPWPRRRIDCSDSRRSMNRSPGQRPDSAKGCGS